MCGAESKSGLTFNLLQFRRKLWIIPTGRASPEGALFSNSTTESPRQWGANRDQHSAGPGQPISSIAPWRAPQRKASLSSAMSDSELKVRPMASTSPRIRRRDGVERLVRLPGSSNSALEQIARPIPQGVLNASCCNWSPVSDGLAAPVRRCRSATDPVLPETPRSLTAAAARRGRRPVSILSAPGRDSRFGDDRLQGIAPLGPDAVAMAAVRDGRSAERADMAKAAGLLVDECSTTKAAGLRA